MAGFFWRGLLKDPTEEIRCWTVALRPIFLVTESLMPNFMPAPVTPYLGSLPKCEWAAQKDGDA